MRIIEKQITLLPEDPIEIRAVSDYVGSVRSPYNYHRVEVRMKESYFQDHYGEKIFPEGDGWCEEQYIGLFGRKRTRKVKIKYTNPWQYITYGLKEKYNYAGFDYYVTDKREEFEKIKSGLKTFADYELMCEEEKDNHIKHIENDRYRFGKEWY